MQVRARNGVIERIPHRRKPLLHEPAELCHGWDDMLGHRPVG